MPHKLILCGPLDRTRPQTNLPLDCKMHFSRASLLCAAIRPILSGDVRCSPHEQAIAGLRSFGELETRIAAVNREVTTIQVRISEVQNPISRRSATNAPVLVLLIMVQKHHTTIVHAHNSTTKTNCATAAVLL